MSSRLSTPKPTKTPKGAIVLNDPEGLARALKPPGCWTPERFENALMAFRDTGVLQVGAVVQALDKLLIFGNHCVHY